MWPKQKLGLNCSLKHFIQVSSGSRAAAHLTGVLNSLLFKLAKHWIAGDTYQDAFVRAQQSSPRGVHGIINLLGEDKRDPQEITAHINEYLEILDGINSGHVDSCISVKPTQLGLCTDYSLYKENMETILARAKSYGNFVWIDMENHQYTAQTVDSYLDFRKGFDNVGVAIQAYMKRSEDDVNRILDAQGMMRLVKGAYNEPEEFALKDKKLILANYMKLMGMMFERGKGFAMGTHDDKLIEKAMMLSKEHPTQFEFEMLMGIRDNKKLELVEQGFRVSEYIPYGKEWRNYSMRRIREHKSNILLLARSLVSG